MCEWYLCMFVGLFVKVDMYCVFVCLGVCVCMFMSVGVCCIPGWRDRALLCKED